MVLQSGFCIVELQYIGSYTVKRIEEDITRDYIRTQVSNLQKKGRPTTDALLIISVAGVKVTDSKGKVVFITNSLYQINYCSFLREDRIFCFLSRESSRHEEVHQYCHIFTTETSKVDEVNDDIRNALSSAHEAKTTVPQKPVISDGLKSKIARSTSYSIKKDTNSQLSKLSQSLNLSSSFSAASSSTNKKAALPLSESLPAQSTSLKLTTNKDSRPSPLTESLDSGALRRLIRAKILDQSEQRPLTSSTSAVLSESLDERSLRKNLNSTENKEKPTPKKTMLKHTLSAQAKLEANKAKHINPFDQSLSNVKSQTSPNQRVNCNNETLHNSYPFVKTDSGHKCVSDRVLLSKHISFNKNHLSGAKSDADISIEQSLDGHWKHMNSVIGRGDNYSLKSNSSMGRFKDGHENVAYQPDEESQRLCYTLPPPTAFSDFLEVDETDPERRGSYNDVFKDYIDYDKKSINNNNPDAMSFYSDNYMKTGTLTPKHEEVETSPTSQAIDRMQAIRQSMMSSGSSGISINSIESEIIQSRPLPLAPGDLQDNRGANTPLRYQNDSPFRLNSHTNENKRLTQSHGSLDLERTRSADDILRQVPWFQPHMTRDQVLEMLSKEDLGSFIIRESTTHELCFALSVKVPKFNNPSGIAHYIIHRTESDGFKIKGLEKEWPNLSALVTHHTIMPELLPCTLKVPHPVMTRRHGSTASRCSNSSLASRASSGSDNNSIMNSLTSADRRNSPIDALNNSLNNIQLTISETV